ncbi:DUF2911 domain-containing protein [Cyclobacterium amurskyense]|uniref:DUF2911 domain-containing protein n=1 Tax=Cyclobacterium amurskyense TaxID=320787 RepID=A0A0H4PAT6_9BACT|nr:DUF2911 domain-containing protein [Cyclobacterium amurskyense]AKP51546.1 hypothetical protein CA2015_2124 [Cyclobacterium amurskyense]
MKNTISLILCLSILFFLLSCNKSSMENNEKIENNKISLVENSNLRLPTKSQFASVSQVIGTSDIFISYFRPSVNNRTIWGDVVLWDSLWRAGAEGASTFRISNNARVGGKPIPKGDYSFFVIPRKNLPWTIIFNKNINLFGIHLYDENEDVLRFDADAINSPFVETMTFTFSKVNSYSTILKLSWAEKTIEIPIDFDKTTSWNNIKKFIENNEQPDSLLWRDYLSIGNYCVFTEDKDYALYSMGLIDKSLDIQETFENLKIKSDLYAVLSQYDSASKYAKDAHALGSTTGMPLHVANLLEENIRKYNSLNIDNSNLPRE